MQKRTVQNGAPAWELTELAVAKGYKLARKYRVDANLVVTALYLAHTVFTIEFKAAKRKNHPELSARFTEPYLKRWGVTAKEREVILNAIRAHHSAIPTETLEAEVMKNAECFKFVTLKGVLIYLHDLGKRNVPFKRAVGLVKAKVNEKYSYLTLKDCKIEARKNLRAIEDILSI